MSDKTYWETTAEDILANFKLDINDRVLMKKLIIEALKVAHRDGMAYERSRSQRSY